MKVMVVDEQKEMINEPYVVRLGGWTLERYLREAPEQRVREFVRGEVLMFSPATAEGQRRANGRAPGPNWQLGLWTLSRKIMLDLRSLKVVDAKRDYSASAQGGLREVFCQGGPFEEPGGAGILAAGRVVIPTPAPARGRMTIIRRKEWDPLSQVISGANFAGRFSALTNSTADFQKAPWRS
jgi:hypothetical protein